MVPIIGIPAWTALFVSAVQIPKSLFAVVILPVNFYLECRVPYSHFKGYSFAFIQNVGTVFTFIHNHMCSRDNIRGPHRPDMNIMATYDSMYFPQSCVEVGNIYGFRNTVHEDAH